VVTGSVSKLGVTSPRIGWVVGPEELVERCWVIKDYTTLGHSGLGEVLAGRVLGMRESLMERNLAYSRANLEILGEWIGGNPHLSWVEPRAGFTGFPRYAYEVGSVDFCERLLEDEGVLLSPGAFFGVEGYLRICTGVPVETLKEGMGRIESFIGRLG
jgi:aspartate/methionine/tyrosine aminotransferase